MPFAKSAKVTPTYFRARSGALCAYRVQPTQMAHFMNYMYRHDSGNEVVYKFPEVPDVENGGSGVGFVVSMVVEKVSARNVYDGMQWSIAFRDYPREFFDHPGHTRDQAIRFFMNRRAPVGEEISES